MIRNDQQRAVTIRKRDEARTLAKEGDDRAREVYGVFADDLDEQVREYDAICSRHVTAFKLNELDDLVSVLVKCRLARGWTQGELADVVGVAEQQVQRYEAGGYEKAALWRVSEVIDALGYEVEGVVRPQQEFGGGHIRWDVKTPFASIADDLSEAASTIVVLPATTSESGR